MHRIRNLDLKNKLVLLATISGAMAVLMACTGFVWHDLQLLRFGQIDQLRTQAEMLADQSIGAVSLGSDAAELSLLSTWKPRPSIDAVCLFNRQGAPVSCYRASNPVFDGIKLPDDHYSHRYTQLGELELFHPIICEDREIGVVYLKANMREFHAQRCSYATVVVIVMSCSLAVAVIFASMMQSLISKPILDLAEAARTITTHNDYTIRVTTDSQDELDVLYRSFNQMVEQIQSSRAALEQAHHEMENRVEQRTCQLQAEIVERERVQQELVRAKEAAEAASEAKSRFVANMSHEIRTPLNGILGFADYILTNDRQLAEFDRRDYLSLIRKSGEGLLVLINDILDLSKIEAGQMEFEKVHFSPHTAIAEVISILRPMAREKNLNLGYRWEGAIPQSIESDPLRLRQLLTNLVGNAIKFSEVGRVEIVARLESSTRTLAVDVVDTGIGIPLETQRVLFEPFTQGDSSVTRRFGGTGLGLSICKFIAKGLGGVVSVKSQVGHGSTFTFTIDTGSLDDVSLHAEPCLDAVAEETGTSSSSVLASKRILVADDGETNRKLIRLVLEQAGAEVFLVEDGTQAVAAVHKSTFDLIVMDMQMPVLDGYSASRRLRAEGFGMPIVALTAHAMRGDEDRCLEAGCSAYLTKPIRQELLLTKLATLIAGQAHQIDEETDERSRLPADGLTSELPIAEAPFAELVCEFIGRARQKMDELRTAHRSHDRTRMAKLAHWMKGSGGMAGFPIVTDLARTLENHVREAEVGSIEHSLQQLEDLLDQLHSPNLAVGSGALVV